MLDRLEINYLQKLNNSNINQIKKLFPLLITFKILYFGIIYSIFFFISERPEKILKLPDLVKYENIDKLSHIFTKSEWVGNVGFRIFSIAIDRISLNLSTKYFLYAIFSLILMSLAQSLILRYIFSEKDDSNIYVKSSAICLSILNLYILIYSFKASTDVFACLGIVLFILGFIKLDKKWKNGNKYFLPWLASLLILSLFRNTLFLLIPSLFFMSAFRKAIYRLKESRTLKTYILIAIISTLVILNIYQILNYIPMYLDQQKDWGIFNISNSFNEQQNLFKLLVIYLKFIILKIIFLFSVREAVGMTGNLLSGHQGYPFVENFLPSLFSLIVNITGIVSIFKIFSKKLRKSFLLSFIPLIPILSFAAHHRYFLPYSLITTACAPFLFENKITSWCKKIYFFKKSEIN